MKKYFMKNHQGWANTYVLAYAETSRERRLAADLGYERISRKRAEYLCAKENVRRRDDANFAYFADNEILPIGYNADWRDDPHMRKNGYIIERINKEDQNNG